MGTGVITESDEDAISAVLDSVPVLPTLELIHLTGDQRDASIRLRFNGNPGYLLYTLPDPPRAVVELERTLLAAELPVLNDNLPLLARVRTRQLASGSLRVIFDLHRTADIQSTDVISNDGFKELVINLTPNHESNANQRRPPDGITTTALPADNRLAQANAALADDNAKSPKTTEISVFRKVPSQGSADFYRDVLAFAKMGRLDKAQDALEAVLTVNPEHADARMTLVSNLVQQNRTHDALKVLREGLDIAPTEPKLASLYARLLVRLGKLEFALQPLKKAAPELANDPAYHAFIAAVSQRLGEHRAAADTYQHVLEYAPENGVWWMGMAISLEALDEDARAMKAYQRALEAPSLTSDLQRYVDKRLSVLKQLGSS